MGGDCFTAAAERGGRGLARRQACVEQASFPKTAFCANAKRHHSWLRELLLPRSQQPVGAAWRLRTLARKPAAELGCQGPRPCPCRFFAAAFQAASRMLGDSGDLPLPRGRGCWDPWVPVGAPGLSGTSRCSFAQPGRPVSLWVGMSHLRAGAGMGTGLSLPENDQLLSWTPGCLSALPTAPAGRLGCVHTSPHRRPGRQPSRAGRAPSSACAGGPPRARA